MLTRDAGRDLIRDVAAPLRFLVGSTQWPGEICGFDMVKNGVSSIVAHLAYCHITNKEEADRNRATLVPCSVFQQLVAGEPVDFLEAANRADLNDVQVYETEYFVAVSLRVDEIVFVGVRGSVFGFDWKINSKAYWTTDKNGRSYHSGFRNEAGNLCTELSARLARDKNNGYRHVYLSGHSLGGAVASILNDLTPFTTVPGCYIFGAPRVSGKLGSLGMCQHFATRRHLDVVPYVPLRSLGYEDHPIQLEPDGTPFVAGKEPALANFLDWLSLFAVEEFKANHAMEQYRLEVLGALLERPGISKDWRFEDILP